MTAIKQSKEVPTTLDSSQLRADMKQALALIREELDEHLDTINENTVEIEQNYNYLSKIETKLDKLTERVDDLLMRLAPEQEVAQDIALTTREQEVFLVLYTSPSRISPTQIARRLGLTEEMVHNYLFNLMAKKIPVHKVFDDGQMLFELETSFKDLQARKNLLKINESVSRELLNERML
ncbi:MAG: hypothetical protein ABIA93_07130 [Candidatus Woesearchaeota archaeon]